MGFLFHPGWLIVIGMVVYLLYRRTLNVEHHRIVEDLLKEARERQERQNAPVEELVGAARSYRPEYHSGVSETQQKPQVEPERGGETFSEDRPFVPDVTPVDPAGKRSLLPRLLLTAGAVILLAWLFRPLWLPVPADIVGTVVRVSDGDTLEVLDKDHRTAQIRLYGIDAPEKGQPFGEDAKQLATRLAFGKEVRVYVKDHDRRYNRLVGEVRIGRAALNKEMVKAGLAWAYRHYTDKYAPPGGEGAPGPARTVGRYPADGPVGLASRGGRRLLSPVNVIPLFPHFRFQVVEATAGRRPKRIPLDRCAALDYKWSINRNRTFPLRVSLRDSG